MPMIDPVPGTSDAPTRPDSVRLALELWCAVIVAELIAFIAQYGVLRDRTQEILDSMEEKGEPISVSATSMAVLSMIIMAVILIVITVVVMKFTWDGRNWARQVLGVFSAFLSVQLVFGIVALFADTDSAGAVEIPAWAMIFEILGGVAAVGALIALMHRDTSVYCRDKALWRSRNRQNGGL
ncbi:hypothetical protein [Gordonia zhaorongruii]|uniref:hypothetical protein n=1 Tax=Gordonia zhaorongruii TaxID=2597659 RepID=UPI00117E11C8|nr:hypothetical protein [Gordonia zhaorongruii]